jgi:hypothetical protein
VRITAPFPTYDETEEPTRLVAIILAWMLEPQE